MLALAGVLASSGCLVRASDGNSPIEQTINEREVAAATAQLAPDPRLYTTQTFDWMDSKRDRPVPARVYLPATASVGAAATKVPLVVFSHGIGGSREGYKYLGRYFAANGYASLHVQHTGSDRQVWFGNPFMLLSRLNGAANEAEAVERARDISFALDQFLASDFGQRVDATRIVVAGHSYGANTSMLLAGAKIERDGKVISMRDPRFRAAILLSAPPFYGSGDAKQILANVDIPTLHITATDDDIPIPGYRSGVSDRIEVYEAMGNGKGAPKALAIFKGGSHSIFTDRLGTGGVELNPKVKLATRDLAVSFLNSLYRDDAAALGSWQERYAGLVDKFDRKAIRAQ
jgi:dienelactone hydrolase